MSKDKLETMVVGIGMTIFGVVCQVLGVLLRSNPISFVGLLISGIYFTYCGGRYLYNNSKRGR